MPILSPFRESWIYNNLLYAIANHVGEVKTGQPYENLVITKIVAALGMGQASCETLIYITSSQTNYEPVLFEEREAGDGGFSHLSVST